MGEYLTVNGSTFDKFHVIRPADRYAGFCAMITYALNEVRLALGNNWLPVVNYNNYINSYFYDPACGDNVWEYYFEPLMGISYTYVKQLLSEGKIPQKLIHSYPAELIVKWHHEDPDRIATFWACDPPENPAHWMALKRQLGREYVSRYIRVKPHILAKVEQFHHNNIKSWNTCGIHIRGTDFAYAEPTKPEVYFRAIYQWAANSQHDDFKLFLATDQQQFVEMFQREFGERVITYSSIRSSSDVPAFFFNDVSAYKKGEDVLIDILLLSQCNYLLKCAAAVGEYALWFNPELNVRISP